MRFPMSGKILSRISNHWNEYPALKRSGLFYSIFATQPAVAKGSYEKARQ
jgi:hypothetical protein